LAFSFAKVACKRTSFRRPQITDLKSPKKESEKKKQKNPTEKSQSNSFDPAADMEPALPIKRANKAPCKNDRKAYLQKVMLTR